MARQCHRQEERLRLRQRGRKGRPPCRTDSHGLEFLGETEKAAGEATDGNGRKNGTRCDGKCSALHFPVHFPRQSRAKRTHFSSCLLLHSDQPTLSSSSTLFSAPANPRFLSHQHVLRPSEPPTPSTASPLVFHSLRTCLPLPAHSSSTASTLVFHSKRTCLPLPERLPPHCQSVCLPPANTIVFHNQNVRLPLPTRSFSSACTIVFHDQNVRLPLPARSFSSACTFGFSCQNPRNPQPTESYSQPTGSPASTHAARAAR